MLGERMDGGGGEAARHVGPPRTLDVQQFAAARSSEVQALYNALKAQKEANNSSGVSGHLSSSLTTPRHLRRRTASHNRRIPFRWMHNTAQSSKTKKRQRANAGSPHLQSNVAATSVGETSSKRKKAEKRLPSRRVRRRIELQGVREGTVSCMRDGTRRLATHVWHAKRFPMANTWGYRLPQGLPGKGHGSKALFKWVKEAAVLHDASYIGVIELEGTKDGILRILSQALEPPPGRSVSGWPVEEEEMHGLLYGNAVVLINVWSQLQNAGKVPREAIAPVTTLWRPSSFEARYISEHSTGGEGRGEERQLWIWLHPSAFDDAFLALSTACEGQGLDDSRASVKCRSRRGELARLDILGSRASEVLQKVLRPVPRKVAHPSSTEIAGLSGHQEARKNVAGNTSPDVSQSLSSRLFAKADCLPAAAVIALDVYDPRDTPRSFYSVSNVSVSGSAQASFTDSNLPGNTLFTGDHSMEEEIVVQNKKPDLDIKEDEDVILWESLLENDRSKEVSDSPHLWSPLAEGMVAALSQKAFSKKRQKRRKAYFTDVDDFSLSSLEPGALDSREEQGGACPILLLKQAHFRTSVSGWSIIVPITWVHAFWVPLVFAGGHVIGLRERQWLATDAGLPYFPHDFPDCRAHAQHLGVASAAFNSANQARPPSKRSPSFSVSPLQWSVMNAYKDPMLDGSGGDPAVAFELIDKGLGEQSTGEMDTTPKGTPRLKDLDGDTSMTEAGITEARAPSPPVIDTGISDFRNLDGDTEMAGTGDTVISSPVSRVSQVGCQTVHEVVFHQPHTTVPDESAKEDCSPDRVSSLPVAPHGTDAAVLRESTELEGGTAMPVNIVTSSPVSLAACQTVDGAVIPDFANLEVDVAMTGLTTLVTSSPLSSTFCQLVDNAVIPEFAKVAGATAIIETGVIFTKPPATCQATEGVIVPELTKALGDNAVREADSLPNEVPSLLGASVDATIVHGLTSVDGASALAETEINVALPPSSEIAAEGLSPRQLTKPLGEDATVTGDVLKDELKSSRAASELQQPAIDAHDSDPFGCGRLSSGEKSFVAEEIIDSPPINLPYLEVPGRVPTLTNPHGRDQSPSLLPGSPGEHPFPVSKSNLKSIKERSSIPIFVARTADALMQVFKENGLQHALLLCSGSMKYRGAHNGLRNGTLEWRASDKPVESAVSTGGSKIRAVVGGHVKGCYVRVLIVVPRKGVMKENGVLCSPTKEDFDSFLSRSQHWQGVEASWVSPQSKELKKRKGKRKGKEKGKDNRKTKGEAADPFTRQSNLEAEEFAKVTTRLDVGYEECSNREIIGCITSTGPQGSLWSGTGICEAGSLMKLRAMQWQHERWWNEKEILLLAGSQLSPILRPVVVSVVLETSPQEDVMW